MEQPLILIKADMELRVLIKSYMEQSWVLIKADME